MIVGFLYDVSIVSAGHVVIYDYAKYNKLLLNNESIIIAKNTILPLIYEKFLQNKNIKTKIFDGTFSELCNVCNNEKIDILYQLTNGLNFENVPNVKNCVHAVFFANNPIGDKFATVSEYLAKKDNCKNFVSHIIELPDVKTNLRKELNIPENAIVFGRHGSYTEFNLDFVKFAVERVVNDNSNIWFLFLNTQKFYEHPHIIYLDTIIDLKRKVEFINSCDAMIHGRSIGESFGMAVVECAYMNKPVITLNVSDCCVYDRAHIEDTLQDKIRFK